MRVDRYLGRMVTLVGSRLPGLSRPSVAWFFLLTCGALGLRAADSPAPPPRSSSGTTGALQSAGQNPAARRHRAPRALGQLPDHAPLPAWVIEGDPTEGQRALHVADAGDVNGDGYSDVLAWRAGYKDRPGVVMAYYGSSNGLSLTPNWRAMAPPDKRGHWFGVVVVGVGDVNGDGYDDVLVLGNPILDLPGPYFGEAYLFYGSSTGLQAQAGWEFTSPIYSMGVVDSAGKVGNVKGDGYSAFYIATVPAEPQVSSVQRAAGRSFRCNLLVFYGGPQGPRAAPDRQYPFESPDPENHLRAASAGDVNGDGYDDFMVADMFWTGSEERQGRVLVYHGSPAGLPAEPNWSATFGPKERRSAGISYLNRFGWSVASAGDVDGDGFDDVVIGAPFASMGDRDEGVVFIYHGSPLGLERRPRRILHGSHEHAQLGEHVSGGGDVYGAGFDGVLAGAPQITFNTFDQGMIALFAGSKRGLSRSPAWSCAGEHSYWQLGRDFCFAGDVNGDGCDDVLISERAFQRNGQEVGRARLFYGSPKGLSGSANWRMEKPFLAVLQRFHDRTPPAWKWSGALALLALTIALFLAWRRALARLRANERQQARNQERERLARDMHDHLGASLSQIALWSDLTKNAAVTPQKVEQNLDRISDSARGALDSMNDLVGTLSPGSESLEDFATRLIDSAERSLEVAGVRLKVEFQDPLPALDLDVHLRSQLMLIAREALRNVARHAQAQNVTLELSARGGILRFAIADDGRGFNPAIASQLPSRPRADGGGHGLPNLRARAQGLGGRLEFVSVPGQGTSIVLRAPLNGRRP